MALVTNRLDSASGALLRRIRGARAAHAAIRAKGGTVAGAATVAHRWAKVRAARELAKLPATDPVSQVIVDSAREE